MTKPAAIYARVSSDRQKEDHTIASQTAALIQYAEVEGSPCPQNGSFKTKDIAGPVLFGPVWKRFGDLAAEGHIEVVLIHQGAGLGVEPHAHALLIADVLEARPAIFNLQ